MISSVICGDAVEVVRKLETEFIDMVITSPPYYNARESIASYGTVEEYIGYLEALFDEVRRILAPGSRIAVNLANYGRYIPLTDMFNIRMLDLGYIQRGEIIWDKGASVGSSTAWGSWMSPSNPTLRDRHEYILVYHWGSASKPKRGTSTITRDEFLSSTLSVWQMRAESRKVHPTPFPVELPRRLIQLYTYREDVVLDPFCGSGTTLVAAKGLGRGYVGIDISAEYCDVATARIAAVDWGEMLEEQGVGDDGGEEQDEDGDQGHE